MKKNTIACTFLILAFLSIQIHLVAQDYVISVKGDTLKGEVKAQNFGSNSKVQVKDNDKNKSSFTLFQVKSFTLKGETYRPLKGPNGYCFMKLAKAGYLSLYNFQLPNQTAFDGFYLAKIDGTGMEVPNLGFKKAMANFLSDCSDVAEKINKGDLGKRHLDTIIDEYNACIQKNSISQSNHSVQQQATTKKIDAWDTLEQKLKGQADFEGKTNALEMIVEVKNKISKGETVPNFLVEGLKNILNPTELKGDLENALNELK
jgi:hypothetical protein